MDKDHWINKDNLWHDYHTMDYLCHNNHYLYKKYPSIGNLACISLKPLKSQNKYIYYTKEPYFQTVPKIKEAKISHRKINGSFFMTPMPSPLNNFSFPTFCILYNSAVVRRLHSATAGLLRAGRGIDRRPTSPYEPGSHQQ